MLEIKTDHKWKQFKYGYDVEKRKDYKDYDWMDENDKGDGWIIYHRRLHHIYHRRLYHISDFVLIENENIPEFSGWNGYHSDSFFSGVLIKVSQDGEQYKIGTYCG